MVKDTMHGHRWGLGRGRVGEGQSLGDPPGNLMASWPLHRQVLKLAFLSLTVANTSCTPKHDSMRLSAGVTAFLSATLAVATAQAQVQVYLHPQPTLPSHHLSAPTLSASQAKAVLAHHLGESADDFEEIPQDESMWRHLLGVWSGQKEERTKARVVIIEGGVSAQGP